MQSSDEHELGHEATGKTVRFGESSADEMCFNFARYYPMGALSCSAF